MSIELIDKEVSTDDLDAENVEEKEVQEQNSKEKEKKETTDLEKLEAVLSTLVENKVSSIRNCKIKEKNFFSKCRAKRDEANRVQSESKINKLRASSPSVLIPLSRCDCHQNECMSLIPCQPVDYCRHQVLPTCPRMSIESTHRTNPPCPQQSLESYDPSLIYKPPDNHCCANRKESDQRLDRKKLTVQKCLPKQLSTEQWLTSTSRQTSTETATTSSGYISPTFGNENRKYRPRLRESTNNQLSDSIEAPSNGDSETIIEISKNPAQISLELEESRIRKSFLEPQMFNVNELEQLKNGNSSVRSAGTVVKCSERCHACVSTTCLPSCRFSTVEDQRFYDGAPNRHLHPSGGHYMSCCNSPTHSFRFQYDDNYLTLAMNLEDLEFEQEEERRKRRKKRKKRRKERQIRARGLMADELKNAAKASKVLVPEDLPKRARWTIVATACLLLLMSMLLVGITLRMAPIIDEMVRKENEEMLHSLNRQGTVKEATATSNITKTLSSSGNSSSQL